MTLVFGKLTISTGVLALAARRHVTQPLTSTALLRFGSGVGTLGRTGPLAQSAVLARQLKVAAGLLDCSYQYNIV